MGFVFYDLETTGISPAYDQPLQFAAIKERLKNLPFSALSDRLGHRHEAPRRCRNSPPFPVFVMR